MHAALQFRRAVRPAAALPPVRRAVARVQLRHRLYLASEESTVALHGEKLFEERVSFYRVVDGLFGAPPAPPARKPASPQARKPASPCYHVIETLREPT
eukprot:5082694-Prymnesium_polylepis.1